MTVSLDQCTCEAFEPVGDPLCAVHDVTDETVTWSCEDCGEQISAPTYLDLRQCGMCGEWQDVPDGSGLRLMED